MEARARRVLQGRRAPPATVDDALQTAALRALHRDRRFDTIDGWVNWTIEVAWHEAQIEWRRQVLSAHRFSRSAINESRG